MFLVENLKLFPLKDFASVGGARKQVPRTSTCKFHFHPEDRPKNYCIPDVCSDESESYSVPQYRETRGNGGSGIIRSLATHVGSVCVSFPKLSLSVFT